MLHVLRNNINSLFSAIEDCRNRKQILPCLILIYCGIDVVASLEKSKEEGTASAFQRWANNYLLPEENFGCTSKELYGARCGIVHTFSAASDYSRSGKAREVVYAWGTASAKDLRSISKAVGRDHIVLDVDELIKVFRNGVYRFFSELLEDPKREKLVAVNASVWFTNMDKAVIDNVLNIIDKSPDT
jgi:hypothetical protein